MGRRVWGSLGGDRQHPTVFDLGLALPCLNTQGTESVRPKAKANCFAIHPQLSWQISGQRSWSTGKPTGWEVYGSFSSFIEIY